MEVACVLDTEQLPPKHGIDGTAIERLGYGALLDAPMASLAGGFRTSRWQQARLDVAGAGPASSQTGF